MIIEISEYANRKNIIEVTKIRDDLVALLEEVGFYNDQDIRCSIVNFVPKLTVVDTEKKS